MKQLYAVVSGPFDSKKLYRSIQHLGDINVTDLGDKVLVYGDVAIEAAAIILDTCAEYGDVIESKVGD